MAQSYAGRLELTWTNKALALLAGDDGSYQWVPPSDYRVAEVRLLHDTGSVGDVRSKRDRAKDNLLIQGDALNALTSLIELPEFAREYVGKVKLAYLDPPFNTRQSFLHYDDALEHSVWLTMMRDRLTQIRTLLSDDGSVWVHCDDTEQAYLKSAMDEVFGRACFQTAFIWRKVDSPNDNKVPVTPDHDYILCYTKTAGVPPFQRMSAPALLDAYPQTDNEGQRYRDRLLKKNGKSSLRTDRPSMFYPLVAPNGVEVFPIHDDGREACWSVSAATAKKLADSNQIIWKQRNSQWVPYTREWAPTVPERPYPSIWTDLPTTRQAKAHLREMFPGVDLFDTPKPEELIERIVYMASRPGEIVLDCFGGSGTSAAVATKLGRRWVLVERETETVSNWIIPRLTQVISGDDQGGVSEDLGWSGGGGFRSLCVAPSMFEESAGTVVLAEWATNGHLSEATAAQLGFDFDVEPPFVGRKGRKRLAVIDGMVTVDVVTLLTEALGTDERLTVCGMAFDPDARQILREKAPGSTLRKIPSSILDEYVLRRMEQDTAEAAVPVAPVK